MGKKITYLLGAGASYNALPIIDELPNILKYFCSIIGDALNYLKAGIKCDYDCTPDELSQLLDDINKLQKELKSHRTIDTLAKKYYLIKNKEKYLITLKKITNK